MFLFEYVNRTIYFSVWLFFLLSLTLQLSVCVSVCPQALTFTMLSIYLMKGPMFKKIYVLFTKISDKPEVF